MDGGSIVIVSSIASQFIVQEQGIGFHITKAASDQLVRYYAVKLGPQGIRVNGINPGRIIKDESKDYYQRNERLKKIYEAVSPLGRLGTAEEMANVIKFLCSPGASYVTGQCIVLDGGLSLHGHDSIVRLALAAEGISLD
jgi:NAD(P)-dependent dehydrogenase (short-subunit alcohol dehydrogenase family)